MGISLGLAVPHNTEKQSKCPCCGVGQQPGMTEVAVGGEGKVVGARGLGVKPAISAFFGATSLWGQVDPPKEKRSGRSLYPELFHF